MADDADVLTLDSQLCFALYSTMHALNKTYLPLLRRLGLTYPQYLVMLVLWESEETTLGALGRRLQLDSGTLTPLVKRLALAGLVVRERDPGDERQLRIGLTTAGRDLRTEAGEVATAVACATGRTLDELTVLRHDLLRLRRTLGREAARDLPAATRATARRSSN